jgi:hypothetical protein
MREEKTDRELSEAAKRFAEELGRIIGTELAKQSLKGGGKSVDAPRQDPLHQPQEKEDLGPAPP